MSDTDRDASSVLASAERDAPPLPTPEELEVRQFNAEVRNMLRAPQAEEDREADQPDVDRIKWVPPEGSAMRDDEDAAAWFNRQFR